MIAEAAEEWAEALAYEAESAEQEIANRPEFHPAAEGWRIAEANRDVPGGKGGQPEPLRIEALPWLQSIAQRVRMAMGFRPVWPGGFGGWMPGLNMRADEAASGLPAPVVFSGGKVVEAAYGEGHQHAIRR